MCGFGRYCFNSTCTNLFSLPDGTNLSYTQNFNLSSLCKSAYAGIGIYGNQTIYCQPRPVNVLDVMRGYPTPTICNFTLFLNPNNWKEPTNVNDPNLVARCGYNQDPAFYCTMWLGDKYLSNLIDSQISLLPGVWNKCSVNSLGLDPRGCARILSGYEIENHLRTSFLEVDYFDLWPQIANNAPCVKNTITRGFWFPLAFSSIFSTASAFFAVIISLAF